MSRAHRTAGACMTTRSSRSFCSALRSIRLSTNVDERCIKDAAFCSVQKLHAMLSHDGCGSKEKKGGRCGIATTPGVAPKLDHAPIAFHHSRSPAAALAPEGSPLTRAEHFAHR